MSNTCCEPTVSLFYKLLVPSFMRRKSSEYEIKSRTEPNRRTNLSTKSSNSSSCARQLPSSIIQDSSPSQPISIFDTESSNITRVETNKINKVLPRPKKNLLTSKLPEIIEVSSVAHKDPGKPLCCDKCDGKHETTNCPYYKKQRDNHPDAQKGNKKMGGTSTLPDAFIRTARVAKQPGDGSCLFHSLSHGLRDGSNAHTLRKDICSYIERNPSLKISDTPLSDWVRWDAGTSVLDYAKRMSRGAWGGGIEMATVSNLKKVNVHVYERYIGGFKRISAFDYPDSPETKPVVRVLYCGGVHYDALVI